MAALRSLGTTLCIVVILAASMLSNGAAHAGQESSATRRPNDLSVRPFAAFVTEASKRFGVPEHWIGAVLHVESGAKQRARSSKGAMGLMQMMPKTWTELRARYGLGADPYDPVTTSWPVLHTSANSTTATARQGFWPPTMQHLDATNVIWQRVDRCRMRHKRTSRRSHRESTARGPTCRLVRSQDRLPGLTLHCSRRAPPASHRMVALRLPCIRTARHALTAWSIYRPSYPVLATYSYTIAAR
jgi:Transglycosylase SLT domain